MPAYVVPEQYLAGKRFTLAGVTYEPGDEVPASVVAAQPRLSALLGNRTLVPVPDPHHRRTAPQVATPTDVPARVRPLLVTEEEDPEDPEPPPEGGG